MKASHLVAVVIFLCLVLLVFQQVRRMTDGGLATALSSDLMAYVEANDFHLPMNWAEFQKWYEANHKKSRWRSSELDMLFDLKWGADISGLTNGVKMLTVRDQNKNT